MASVQTELMYQTVAKLLHTKSPTHNNDDNDNNGRLKKTDNPEDEKKGVIHDDVTKGEAMRNPLHHDRSDGNGGRIYDFRRAPLGSGGGRRASHDKGRNGSLTAASRTGQGAARIDAMLGATMEEVHHAWIGTACTLHLDSVTVRCCR